MEASADVIVPGRRLGKLAPKFDDRTLRLARYVARDLPKRIPKTHTLSKKVAGPWGMMRNDALGDCTCAAIGHATQIWTAWNGGIQTPSDDEVVALYNTVNNGQDNGANMLDVLNRLRVQGIGGRPAITAFAAFGPKERDMYVAADYLFGGVYIGISLPVTAQTQKVWDYLPNTNGNEPGSWGGHAVWGVDVNRKGPVVVTWGELTQLTWSFVEAYCDEMYALISPDWLGDDRKTPQGFRMKQLLADLGAIQQRAAA